MNRILKFILIGTVLLLAGLALASPPVALAGSGQAVSRDYAWSSDSLTLEVPADLHFRPGASWHLTIRAPERVLGQLVVEHGVIKARRSGCFSLVPFCIGYGSHIDQRVHIELTGPALRSIRLEGAGDIDLDGLHQDRLMLTLEGSSTVRGSGTVSSASLKIDGAGNIHLARLTETRAQVIIHGSGTVDIAPTDSVSVHIDGAGTVRLHSDPPHVTSHIFGAGDVIKVGASPPAAAHAVAGAINTPAGS